MDKPSPVDPSTSELWKSLGIHVPPTVLRQSREHHENALHKVLTTIAVKLEEIQKTVEANARVMALQSGVDEEFAKMRKSVSSQEAKVLNAARSSVSGSVATMQDRIDRQNQKVDAVVKQTALIWEETKGIKEQLLEEDVANEMIEGSDVDAINLKASDEKMQALFAQVAESSQAAESRMELFQQETKLKEQELAMMRKDMDRQGQLSNKNAVEREKKLHSEMVEMQRQAAKAGGDAAAAVAEAEAAAAEKMRVLQGEISSSAGAAGSELAKLQQKMAEQEEAHARERAEMAAAEEEKRLKMEADLEARLGAVSQGGGGSSAEEVAALLEQQHAMMKEQAESQKRAAALAESHVANQVEELQRRLEDERARSPAIPAGEEGRTEEEDAARAERFASIEAQMEAERERLAEMQRNAATASAEHDQSVADEMARLRDSLAAADQSGGMEGISAEMDKMRKEATARMEEQSKAQDEERARVMAQMQAMQEKLNHERIENEKLALVAAQRESKEAQQYAAMQAAMDEQAAAMAAKLAAMVELEKAGGGESDSENNNKAALQAMKEELEADRRKASDDQAALAELEAAAVAKAAELAAAAGGALEPPSSPATPSATPAKGGRKELSSRGMRRMERKVNAAAEMEDLRGRVGGLTLKMSKLARLLKGSDVSYVTEKIEMLEKTKADKTMVTDLEDRMLEAGVGGGESMGNSLMQMENNIEKLTDDVAQLVVSKPSMEQVDESTAKTEDRLRLEIEKQAMELVKVYTQTSERLDGVDETKAEKDWIQDLIDNVRRQVGSLKKKLGEGGSGAGDETEGRLGHLQGAMQMFVKGEHPPNWPPPVSHDASNRTIRGSGGGSQVRCSSKPVGMYRVT